jgi:hypothetical protein
MAIVQTQCTIFKYNLLNGLENFTGTSPYVYNIALYNADASLDATTVAYSTTNEVIGSGYIAGGNTLVIIPPAYSGATAYVSFNNSTWTNANFVCRGALIYNATTNAAIAIINFGSDKIAGPNFTVTFPTAAADSAIIRLS